MMLYSRTMKKGFLVYGLGSLILAALVLGQGVVYAEHQTGNRPPTQQTANTPPTQQTANTPPKQGTGNRPPTSQTPAASSGFGLDVKFKNPLKVDSIVEAISLLMNIILKIALPFVIVMFIWSGMKFILAQGKPDELKKARQIFYGTVIGTLLILGAWTITNAIVGTVNTLMSSTTTN